MSDTASVMKGARSGVQKLIKTEMPHLYDVGCICHLADLTIKAGVKTLPVDIDQLFANIFTIAAREVSRLVRLYSKNLLKTEAILAAGENLQV